MIKTNRLFIYKDFKNLERQIANKEVMAKMNKKKIVAISSEDETSFAKIYMPLPALCGPAL